MGNSLKVRGVITDKHGNITYGSISSLNSGDDRLLVYDPLSPETGSINAGNFIEDTPLFFQVIQC